MMSRRVVPDRVDPTRRRDLRARLLARNPPSTPSPIRQSSRRFRHRLLPDSSDRAGAGHPQALRRSSGRTPRRQPRRCRAVPRSSRRGASGASGGRWRNGRGQLWRVVETAPPLREGDRVIGNRIGSASDARFRAGERLLQPTEAKCLHRGPQVGRRSRGRCGLFGDHAPIHSVAVERCRRR